MKEGSNHNTRLMIIGDLYESFKEFEEMGFLSRMFELYTIYAKYFDKIYIKTYERDRFKNLPENVEHIPFINHRVPFRKCAYFFLAGLLHYRHVDCVEIDGATAIIPALIHKILGARVFLYHNWDMAMTFKEQGKPVRSLLANAIQIIAFKTADVVAVTTDELERVAKKHKRGYNVHLVPNYVNINHFRPITTAKEKNLLIFVGRLHPDKNLEMLLQVMRSLPDFKLWIIGEGILRDELVSFKTEKRIDNVEFIGVIPNEELPTYLNTAEAFILVSHREGHPRALIEAMACGLPCIGTNVDGIREVIIPGETGFLCNKTVDSIRSCVVTMFDDREQMKRLGENARGFAAENYTMEKLVTRKIRFIKG